MESREELFQKLKEWTIKAVEAQKYFNSLLPNLDEGIGKYVLIPEYQAKIEQAKKELDIAITKEHELWDKITRLPK
jgi:hypothetical protein